MTSFQHTANEKGSAELSTDGRKHPADGMLHCLTSDDFACAPSGFDNSSMIDLHLHNSYVYLNMPGERKELGPASKELLHRIHTDMQLCQIIVYVYRRSLVLAARGHRV